MWLIERPFYHLRPPITNICSSPADVALNRAMCLVECREGRPIEAEATL